MRTEKIARDRVWESWSAGSVSFPRSASVLNFEVKILSAEILNCIDQVVALNTFGTSTLKVSYITKKCYFQSTKDDVSLLDGLVFESISAHKIWANESITLFYYR